MLSFMLAGCDDKSKLIKDAVALLVMRQISYEGLVRGRSFCPQFNTVLNKHDWSHDASERQIAHVGLNNILGI